MLVNKLLRLNRADKQYVEVILLSRNSADTGLRVFNAIKHYGLDITGPRGSPVAAANDGEVVITRDAYFSGNTVVLWHGAGLYTAYFHLDRIAVREGQRVLFRQPTYGLLVKKIDHLLIMPEEVRDHPTLVQQPG